MDACRVADGCRAGWHIPRDDSASPDDGIIPHRHARQDQRPGADPAIRADAHRPPEFQTRAPFCRVARMIGGQNLNTGADLRQRPDLDPCHVQHDTAEIQENACPKRDIAAIVAVKGRSDHRSLADDGKKFGKKGMALGFAQIEGGIVAPHPGRRPIALGNQLRIIRPVRPTRQHFFLLAQHPHPLRRWRLPTRDQNGQRASARSVPSIAGEPEKIAARPPGHSMVSPARSLYGSGWHYRQRRAPWPETGTETAPSRA